MKKIVAFGASSSVNSINKQFASFVANKISNSELIILDLNDFEMPIYSEDRERFEAIPSLAYDFKAILKNADGIIISFAEHNGSYTAAFKNIFDWISRIEKGSLV
jgi:chromate reductase